MRSCAFSLPEVRASLAMRWFGSLPATTTMSQFLPAAHQANHRPQEALLAQSFLMSQNPQVLLLSRESLWSEVTCPALRLWISWLASSISKGSVISPANQHS